MRVTLGLTYVRSSEPSFANKACRRKTSNMMGSVPLKHPGWAAGEHKAKGFPTKIGPIGRWWSSTELLDRNDKFVIAVVFISKFLIKRSEAGTE